MPEYKTKSSDFYLQNLKKNPEDPNAFDAIPFYLKDDKEFILNAVKISPNAIGFASSNCQQDGEIFFEYFSRYWNFHQFNDELSANEGLGPFYQFMNAYIKLKNNCGTQFPVDDARYQATQAILSNSKELFIEHRRYNLSSLTEALDKTNELIEKPETVVAYQDYAKKISVEGSPKLETLAKSMAILGAITILATAAVVFTAGAAIPAGAVIGAICGSAGLFMGAFAIFSTKPDYDNTKLTKNMETLGAQIKPLGQEVL